MSHYRTLVIIPGEAGWDARAVAEQVTKLMDPYLETKTNRWPTAQWDYYTIGGRYEGAFGGADIQPVAEVEQMFGPAYYLVTPDGVLHTRRSGYHDDYSTIEKAPAIWQVEFDRLLAQYRDGHLAVTMDVHM